ncbi:MAG: peptidoglycan DD-metalloendopeptidase family protein [Gammaproteobacteria bacterium]|nr:peptidoglycan DD-metalloendopeptidase family protein [Gammaproteobacteria bacterium]
MKNITALFSHSSMRFFLWILLFYLVMTNTMAAENQTSAKAIKKQISQLQSKIEKKQSRLERENKAIFRFDKRIAENLQQQKSLKQQQTETEQAILSVEREKKSVLADYDKAYALNAELARLYYLSAEKNYFKILLNRGSPEQAARNPVYFSYLQKAYMHSYEDLQVKSLALQDKEKVLRLKQLKLKGLLEKSRARSVALEEERSKRQQYLSDLSQEIKSAQIEQERLQKDEERLRKLALQIERKRVQVKSSASGMGFAGSKNGLNWPVKGKIIGHFGKPRVRGGVKWNGVLIESKFGTPVKAIADGRVVFSDWFGGYGYVLIVEHSGKYMSLYAHNQQLLKSTGDKVRAGETIAEVGNSGRSGEPALYFEVRHQGKPVNPGKWLMARR